MLLGMTGRRRVFVVDADRSARYGLTRLLCTAGHDVSAFGSIDELLGALCPEVSGCLVLDADILESGAVLRAEIEKRGAHLEIIAVTAQDDPEVRRRAAELKAVGLFRKPVDGTALRDAIAWAMRSNTVGANHSDPGEDS
jgi:FixJ family two-component response regulator